LYFDKKEGPLLNKRINEQQHGMITIRWLKQVVEEMKDLTKIWPFLTLKGYVNENSQNQMAATLDEVIQFMKDSKYKLISVSSIENGLKEIVFKDENVNFF
jgi:hypothetical protein